MLAAQLNKNLCVFYDILLKFLFATISICVKNVNLMELIFCYIYIYMMLEYLCKKITDMITSFSSLNHNKPFILQVCGRKNVFDVWVGRQSHIATGFFDRLCAPVLFRGDWPIQRLFSNTWLRRAWCALNSTVEEHNYLLNRAFWSNSAVGSVAQLVCGLLTGMFSSISSLCDYIEFPGPLPGRRTLCATVQTGKFRQSGAGGIWHKLGSPRTWNALCT
jgi:hypothetical protein